MLLGWGEEEERGLASWRERKGGGGARSRPVLKGGRGREEKGDQCRRLRMSEQTFAFGGSLLVLASAHF